MVKNPIVGRQSQNPQLREWHTKTLDRLPGSPAEFDEVAAELSRTLDAFKVPAAEKDEVLAAFAAHKAGVTEGYAATAGRPRTS